jgi:hypothetical protein
VFATTGAYVAGVVSATGNITGNYFLGNGSQLTGIATGASSNISNGTSNVTVVGSGGNVSVGVGGTGNVAVFATTGEYITGLLSATGNVTGSELVANNGLVISSTTVSANVTIPTGYNATSVGPMTINSGISVTISSGSRWLIF